MSAKKLNPGHAASKRVRDALVKCSGLPEAERVAIYNAAQVSLGVLVRDLTMGDPAFSPRMISAERVQANDYNPNKVASTELNLLEESIRADGITMPIVVAREGESYTVIDGFHRREVAAGRLGRRYLPASVIDRPLGDRMASTVRHNRARGKHGVELMGELVRALVAQGWDDARVSVAMGMSVEEVLRLRQLAGIGAAEALAGESYSREWAPVEEGDGE